MSSTVHPLSVPASDAGDSCERVDARVVYLLNFLAPDARAICQAWDRRVRELIVLVSVPMEGNRAWHVDDGGLDLRVQKTFTRTRVDRHPGGYEDVNYVHVPLDTLRQLRRISPDVVVSAELGARTILAALHCMASGWFGLRRRRCQLIIAVSTSPWIESSRSGAIRTWQRRWLLSRADHVTSHGPECRDWLLSLGVPSSRISRFDYSADPRKIYRGELRLGDDGRVTMLTVGQMIDRKGVREGLQTMVAVAQQHPDLNIHWTLLGDGPLMVELTKVATPSNLKVDFRGNVDAQQIQDAYRDHEVLYFPTLGDEWGLVVDEALHSGCLVIGNDRAQSVTTLIRDRENGFVVDTADAVAVGAALSEVAAMSPAVRYQRRLSARAGVANRTPDDAADQITRVIADRLHA